jgi:polysaccharide pyruvyl transferase WcaK-like protein
LRGRHFATIAGIALDKPCPVEAKSIDRRIETIMSGVIEGRRACLLWGGYSWGNTGDELNLAVALDQLRQCPQGELAILSRNPACTEALFPQVAVVPCEPRPPPRLIRWLRQVRLPGHDRRGPGWSQRWLQALEAGWVAGKNTPWARALARAQRLHMVGGGYLTDRFSVEPYLEPLFAAQRLGVPVSTAPLGIGPFTSPRKARLVAAALRGAELHVRDATSLRFCAAHRLPAHMAPDAGFALERVVSMDRAHRESGAPPRVGLCVFPQSGGAVWTEVRWWWEQCLALLNEGLAPARFEGFCFHTDSRLDYQTLAALFESAGLPAAQVRPPETDFRAAIRLVGQFDLVIAARFHAIVVANVLHIPNVAIATGPYYDAKMQAASRPDDRTRLIRPPSDSPQVVLTVCREYLRALA